MHAEFSMYLSPFQELKFYSPDYIEMDRESARKDFEARLKHYEKEYEEISDKCEIERFV